MDVITDQEGMGSILEFSPQHRLGWVSWDGRRLGWVCHQAYMSAVPSAEKAPWRAE